MAGLFPFPKEKVMNSFSVLSCTYDGTAPNDTNPLCIVTGTVNNKTVYPRVFFAYLAAANAAGQMQEALTAILFSYFCAVYGYQFTPWPEPIPFPQYPAASVRSQQSSGPYPVPEVSVQEALIGSWSA
jgi:hypothetical protein